MRSGQGAIEYLMILALVIVIALIIIGAMGGFASISGGVSEKDSATYWAGADVGITRYFISATPDNSMMVIKNNRVFSINVTSITLGDTSVFNTSTQLAPGSSTNITLSNVPSCTAGQQYLIVTVINYTDAVYGYAYQFTGDKPLVGTCQT